MLCLLGECETDDAWSYAKAKILYGKQKLAGSVGYGDSTLSKNAKPTAQSRVHPVPRVTRTVSVNRQRRIPCPTNRQTWA